MRINLKRLLIGKPLKNEDIDDQKYGVLFGLPILASDSISSVAYATEEILLVLVPAIGILAYGRMGFIAAAIIGLLVILTFSYRQTISCYPNGGGAFNVATDNLGKTAGITAGAALAVDYVLTVSVSISSGTAAITSAFPQLLPFTIPICLCILLVIMVGNLRGLKESSQIFSIPTYAFLTGIVIMLVAGIIKYKSGGAVSQPEVEALSQTQPVTLVLLLSAFANGCAALTGVEAVSNAVPNFKKPSVKHAGRVLLLLSLFVLIAFGGTSLLANLYHVVPQHDRTVLSQIAASIFGGGSVMFFFIQITTTIILAMAANTAYSGFPLLVSIMAKEGYAPRQLSMRGDRLSYSNGIVVLTVLAALLIVIFKGNTSALIPLYAIGVFISFSLSQSGMFIHWLKSKDRNWRYKALINGTGALLTSVVVVIIAITKFTHGAWIVVIVIPSLVLLMRKVKKHYAAVAAQLRLRPEEIPLQDIGHDHYRNRVIVPVESINKSSVRALRFAKTISDNVVAFCVCIDNESGEKIKEKYTLLDSDIPLVIQYSPFRKIVEPLLKFIESAEYDCKKGDMITVILPQFTVKKWWHNLLHNHSRIFIERELLKHKHIVVAVMPLQLKDDGFALKTESR